MLNREDLDFILSDPPEPEPFGLSREGELEERKKWAARESLNGRSVLDRFRWVPLAAGIAGGFIGHNSSGPGGMMFGFLIGAVLTTFALLAASDTELSQFQVSDQFQQLRKAQEDFWKQKNQCVNRLKRNDLLDVMLALYRSRGILAERSFDPSICAEVLSIIDADGQASKVEVFGPWECLEGTQIQAVYGRLCSSVFTRAVCVSIWDLDPYVRNFVKGKPIQLIGPRELRNLLTQAQPLTSQAKPIARTGEPDQNRSDYWHG